jgi:hypothetical protein
MRGRIIAAIGLALLVASCAAYPEMGGRTYFGFSITGSTGAPPPPHVRIVEHRYDYDEIPGSEVFVIRDPGADCDVFRYGSSFYMYYGGFWYRSYSDEGGFTAIDVRTVPRPVLQVPPERWRHHPHGGPPGQRDRDGRWGDRDDDRNDH